MLFSYSPLTTKPPYCYEGFTDLKKIKTKHEDKYEKKFPKISGNN